MLGRLFSKTKTRVRLSPLGRTLLKLADINMGSANCTLTRSSDGNTEPEDLGRALFFKADGQLLIRNRALFITTPDGIKAENRSRFKGPGDIISLWFLFDHVPRILSCRVDERVYFSPEEASQLDPKAGIGFKITPLSDISKQDKRGSLRFSHLPGQGVLPVFPHVLFDLFVSATDQAFPSEGAIPPVIENLHPVLPEGSQDEALSKNFVPENLVREFKQAILTNPSENRNVHVSKPVLDEKLNRTVLYELGYSDVLGLGSDELGRNLHIKKPLLSRTKDRRNPHYLTIGDILVLHFGSRTGLDGHFSYSELVADILKGGLENLTVRPLYNMRPEQGFKVALADFSVNGTRFACTPSFLSYVLGEPFSRASLDEQIECLKTRVLLLNFYPKLRFNRETDIYRPELPKRISILGKVVRCEVTWENEEERQGGKITWAGVKFIYDPADYSPDHFAYSRWEMIRAFKENRYFKSVHKSLNGLIAFLESQSKEGVS